ncbi:hypothetical protein OOK39_12215 [Streptomyces sp. NBC_00264]|uniref:hypothetical protein n=1 Tax=unclassified Streptomyces TaxID=2593676 RepID=UPI000F5C0B40|nr:MULTISPECIES: hypothetical protein [unclassified Streptomyces]WSX01293.1 hypothetical protein OG355_13100 [Streptomyces sp. NBC_00987]MCX4396833.1 hypothetical protein [Streptomyces sp. NBC_01767]MCX5160037.1 hypothetical protein [Streptomyces sp. NBC_00305]MCX5218560.1 hypothetical protein [Streptomyces sp. NBC_00264]WSC30412.1 hypothetical protein OG902_29035 [Streptomyces sp. NBC_01768]
MAAAAALTFEPPWQAVGGGLVAVPLIPWVVIRNQKGHGEIGKFALRAVWGGLLFSALGAFLLVINLAEWRFLERLAEAMTAYGVIALISGLCSSFLGKGRN